MELLKKVFFCVNPLTYIRAVKQVSRLGKESEEIKMALGRVEHQLQMLLAEGRKPTMGEIAEFEFKVFSQWGEDGILQYLVEKVRPSSQTFVEFGVENFQESNCRYLLMNNNWSGLVIDGSSKNIDFVKCQDYYWRRELTAVQSFVTRENINDLLRTHGFSDSLGVLSIDVDGNDYWIWEKITQTTPDIVVVEYNSLFGPERDIAIPYRADYTRFGGHSSGMYYGASITAFARLAKEKGYSLVGSNSVGCNLFFVRDEKLGSLKVVQPRVAHRRSKFRDDRDSSGQILYGDFEGRQKHLLGLPVWDFSLKREIPFSLDPN